MRRLSAVSGKWLFTCAVLAVWAVPVPAQEIPQPGPEHKLLEKMAGTWDATVTMEGGAPPMKGTMVYKMELGGFWLVGKFEAEFGGMKFNGTDTTGYDPIRKKYVGTWVDSMSPSMVISTGTYDEAKKALVSTGTGPGPDGRSLVKFKSVSEMKSDDEMVHTMYIVTEDSGESKIMTIEYKRKK